MKIDPKRLRRIIIKKVIIGALIIIAGITLGIISSFADAYTSQIGAQAGFDVMKGNINTVEGMAVQKMPAGILGIGKIVTTVFLFILCFVFITDICIDAYNFYHPKKEEESK
jgi:hypothetical protein